MRTFPTTWVQRCTVSRVACQSATGTVGHTASSTRVKLDASPSIANVATTLTLVTSPRFRRSDQVVFEVTGDRAVLLNPSGKVLITLNPVGTVVWQLLDEPRDAGEVAAALGAAFPDVPIAKLEEDADRFLAELAASDLVVDDAAG